MRNQRQFFSLFVALLTFVVGGFSQDVDKSKIPNVRLSIFPAKTYWKRGERIDVRVTLENLDTELNFIVLPTTVYFNLEAPNVTGALSNNGAFWSPVSLTKKYNPAGNGCQDDLTEERVSSDKGVVSIMPPSKGLLLMKGDRKEFDFDLTKTCWDRQISSYYPSKGLFDEAKTGKYILFCEMQFADSSQGAHIKSNEVEIGID